MSTVQDQTSLYMQVQVLTRLGTMHGDLSISESKTLTRDALAALLLLRWLDLQDSERRAVAIFEDRPYRPVLPESLQWRSWALCGDPQIIAGRLREVAKYVKRTHDDTSHDLTFYLQVLAAPILRMVDAKFVSFLDLVPLVADLPFETPAERRALLDMFDQVIAQAASGPDGEHTTPTNIARIVAVLANPQAGERVYDPCFGGGGFLVEAWQYVERARSDLRRPGDVLDVAGVERNSSAFLIGVTRMLLAGIESPRLQLGDSLQRDVPSGPGQRGFDVVLANPPFAGKVDLGRQLYSHFAIPTTDSTSLFIQHALAQLKPHGRAVVIVPEGFLFRSRGAEQELRRYLLEQGNVEAVISLPAGAFLPYTSIKSNVLVLRKEGGIRRVRMADASYLFEQRSGRKPPVIRTAILQQWITELRRSELRKPIALPQGVPEGVPGTGVLARSMWEVDVEELAAAGWDLTPRRREKGGLDELLAGLQATMGETGSVATLSSVAKIMAGRSIKSTDLLDEPPSERAVGYVRIRDLNQGKVGRVSNWLRPKVADNEQRWALLPGDVLVSKSGTLGKVALVRNGAVGSMAANGLYVLRVDQAQLDAGFLQAYLASPACQNWLAAQSSGTVIQHLNRAVFDDLPVPLPPLQMQARAAAQFREFGTDALTFLAQVSGGDGSGRLIKWLAELSNKLPSFATGADEMPALSQFEPLVAMARTARNWLAHEEVSTDAVGWLQPLTDAVLLLSDVAEIPRGPGLLTVLRDAEHGVLAVLERTTGHLPADSQARDIVERLLDSLRAVTSDLLDAIVLQVRGGPASLPAGSFSEFSLELENQGAMPLRSVRVETSPDWGSTKASYLAERSALTLNLRGEVPKQGDQLALRLHWQARTLTGQSVSGDIELAIRVVESELVTTILDADLGGSPYVTGSPLEPQHGHDVFFGREHLIAQISRQIATHGNVVLLEGNRRAGKTSILKHLEGRSAVPGWLAVYSSLQGAEGSAQAVGVPTAEVFREIARSIATALSRLGIDAPLPNGQVIAAGKPALGVARACREGISDESPFTDFRDYLELALSVLEPVGLGLVLMLDEFDKLQEGIDNGVTSPQVPENIRFLIQTYPKFSAILTGSRRLKRLREEYWSALYGLGTSTPVTSLDEKSARNVVTEPVRDKLTFAKEAVDRVIDVTARHPYLMQCLCNRVFDYAVQTKSRSITLSIVKEAERGLVRDNEHFASLWDYASFGPEKGRLRRQLILLLCAQSFKQDTHVGFGTLHEQLVQAGVDVSDDALDADLAYLRELELIDYTSEMGDGRYRLAIPLMADWIEQQQDVEVVGSRARIEAEEENV